jgi:hypothetical protein
METVAVTQNIHLAVSLFCTRADDTTSRPTNYYNKYMTPVVTHEPFTCPPLKRPLMHISCHIPCHIQQSNHNASHFSNVTTVEVYRRRRQEKFADNTHSHSLTHSHLPRNPSSKRCAPLRPTHHPDPSPRPNGANPPTLPPLRPQKPDRNRHPDDDACTIPLLAPDLNKLTPMPKPSSPPSPTKQFGLVTRRASVLI